MKNWFNEQPHPTDEYIHWSDKNPKETSIKLRAAWDKLAFYDEQALVILMRAAYHMAQCEAAEDAAEEDL